MMSPNSDSIDPWTAMPLEFEDREVEPLKLVTTPAKKPAGKFDIGGMFWRYMASGDTRTPAEVLACLAADERPNIRRRVAENASTPTEVLAQLAKDDAVVVRQAVAKNIHTPVFVLRELAQDESHEVRFAIASNPEMPDAILLSLFLDPDPLIAERASQTLAA
jgi:hypothetical protein